MEKEIKEDIFNINKNRNNVHIVLAYSYSIYLLLFLLGIFFDLVFGFKILNLPLLAPIGMALILLATGLIYWAQRTSRNLKIENLKKESFCKGPYCLTRTPTHWGLFLLILGFGLTINALFIIIFAIVSFVFTKLTYIKKEEKMLENKYGAPYLEYKKSVKF
jgi:protein-S-isoprenylcysteine O-methyltransferase Ste14